MTIKSKAMGMLVEPELKELMIFGTDGKRYYSPTPKAMVRRVHKVRFLSKKLNFLMVVGSCWSINISEAISCLVGRNR